MEKLLSVATILQFGDEKAEMRYGRGLQNDEGGESAGSKENFKKIMHSSLINRH